MFEGVLCGPVEARRASPGIARAERRRAAFAHERRGARIGHGNGAVIDWRPGAAVGGSDAGRPPSLTYTPAFVSPSEHLNLRSPERLIHKGHVERISGIEPWRGGRRLSEFWAQACRTVSCSTCALRATVRLFRLPAAGRPTARGVHLTDLTAEKSEVSLRPARGLATGR